MKQLAAASIRLCHRRKITAFALVAISSLASGLFLQLPQAMAVECVTNPPEFNIGPGTASLACGNATSADANFGVAVGIVAFATGDHATAIGGADILGAGEMVHASGANSTAVGAAANAGDDAVTSFNNAGTTAIGAFSQAGATAAGQTNATAVGYLATANAANATAVGQGSNASAANSVALGVGSVANVANTVSVGAVGAERVLVNVAAGGSQMAVQTP